MPNDGRARRPVGIATFVVTLAACTACSHEPTRPARGQQGEAPGTEAIAIRAERAGMIQAALADARGRSLQAAVARADARSDLDEALALLSARVEARDRRGIERALREARGWLGHYRATLAENSGLLPEIEAISHMLDAVEAAAITEDGAGSAATRRSQER